jgi:hypothetical protein
VVASPGALIGRAEEQTGLSDLGPDGWQVGFEGLVDAVEREVAADPDAVDRIEAMLVERLVQRLRVEQWYAVRGTEAVDPVQAPLAILGLPRTATTALFHLLAIDPQLRHLRSWEVDDPVPPPDAATERDDPRRVAQPTRTDVRHIVAVDGPVEDWPIHAMAFDHAELTLPVPTYSTWWRTRDHSSLFGYHERVLRLLHSHRPPHRWLLKLPAYVFLLPELAAQHPAACFVWTHRDPQTVIASTCSTVAASKQKRTPSSPPGPTFGHDQLEHWADGTRQAMAARDRLGEHRFVDVAQRDLEVDPVGTAERIYAAAGLVLDVGTVEGMRGWAEANRRGSRGEHRYSLEQYGLTATEVDQAFEDYTDRFGELCRAD